MALLLHRAIKKDGELPKSYTAIALPDHRKAIALLDHQTAKTDGKGQCFISHYQHGRVVGRRASFSATPGRPRSSVVEMLDQNAAVASCMESLHAAHKIFIESASTVVWSAPGQDREAPGWVEPREFISHKMRRHTHPRGLIEGRGVVTCIGRFTSTVRRGWSNFASSKH